MKQCSKCKQYKALSEFHKNKSMKDGLHYWCRTCSNNSVAEHYKILPWKKFLKGIKTRCNNPNCKDFKYYGGRGIKCLITSEELKELWFRDRAYLMKKPSIDRIDNDDDYTYKNCRFIEWYKNSTAVHRKRIYQFDLDGKLIKKWNSIQEASDQLNLRRIDILACVNSNFIWKFKTKANR